LTSPDGETWTGGTGPIQGTLVGITYDAAGGYVAVGLDHNDPPNTLYLTSPDGETWTGGTGPIQGELHGIAYGPTGGYVAVGFDNSTPRNTLYLTSPDGETWTGGTGPIQGLLGGITYDAAGGYVAVGINATTYANVYINVYMSSPDGETWTGTTELPLPPIIKTFITIDALIDNTGSTGAPGQVLSAGPTGSGVVWIDPEFAYTPANPGDWTGTSPTTIAGALDRIAAALNLLSTPP
jgi:hypothetical protein